MRAAQDVCPPLEYRPERCRTCCCKTSDNADFFHPEVASQPKCTATDVANYKVSLIPSISPVCHEDYPFVGGVNNAYFSDLLFASHTPRHVFDSCGGEPVESVADYLMRTGEIYQETVDHLENLITNNSVFDYYVSTAVLEQAKTKRRSARIYFSPESSYLTLIVKLVSP